MGLVEGTGFLAPCSVLSMMAVFSPGMYVCEQMIPEMKTLLIKF